MPYGKEKMKKGMGGGGDKPAVPTGGSGVHESKTGGGGAPLGGNRGAEYRSGGRVHSKGRPRPDKATK